MTTNTNGNPGSNSKKRKRGREKGARISVQRPNAISAMADRLSLPDTVLTYQDVADILTARIGIRVTRATVWRFLHEELEPERPALRAALGLPVTAPAPVCPRHGVAHKGRCPKRTFEENAAEYDRWRAANAGRIAAIVEMR